jgi:hypothetical protein
LVVPRRPINGRFVAEFTIFDPGSPDRIEAPFMVQKHGVNNPFDRERLLPS